MKSVFLLGQRSLSFALFLGCCLLAAQSQQSSSKEQTFETEGPFKHADTLPAEALQAIEAIDESAGILQDCAQQEGTLLSQIPPSWFLASEVELNGRNSSGLVVRGEHACLRGAHVTQFWLLARSGKQYRCVFSGRGDALRLLSHRTNGYRDVQLMLIMQAGAEVQAVTARYENGLYRIAGRRAEDVSQP